ncbi:MULTISPECIES: autotransporter outer membrane beta-barrel domain-containing protein [unclassified Campylobacter]|uniref:autotransporter outer membrane beta-barrel domain-containing protein n=1 Tax=unclassified Campylobacter TaxID=2593542 RepID=UPI001BD9C6DF|nr:MULTISPECIES: autotransporter outer membrane beta-barrel domain-containing protein [unclassified Campylobacter]MBT0881511.1 autotransporter outer membrane beta-barrel domain-containing protein [Campylobacter sp. 2018MI27]MBT0885583.1 autotransporter outer membrane beta-barrel domain-containing protein [Campylobacter sp. 2018MI10]
MKKVLFSSVCAVALLGTNVYAVENSLSNSLDTFLSQKTELESKIKEQNTLITQKQESVNNANNDYLVKDKAFKETAKAIDTATLTAGDKQSEKNKAEREHANLVNQGNSLNTQKDNLTSEISQLESSITKYEEELKVLETKLNEAKTNQEEKGKLYKTANDKLTLANADKSKLVTAEKKLGEEHLALQEKYNSAGEEEKELLKQQLDDKAQALTDAQNAIKALDEKNKNLITEKTRTEIEFNQAKKTTESIINNQKSINSQKSGVELELNSKKQSLTQTSTSIEENTKKQADAKANLEKAQKDFENASAAILTAKQNQTDAKTALDKASEDLEKAKAELTTANKDLENLKKELENIEANITNNTEEGKKVKDQLMSSGIYTANTQTHANALISLAASHNGDLSNAAPEVKAQAQTLANQIATTILDEKKDDITAEALSTLNVQINNMNKRLGEVRGLNADIGTWFRIYGGRFSNGNNNFNYYSTQIGADKKTSLNNADILAGVLFGYDKINAGVRAKDTSVGAYLSYIHNDGYFADLVLKYIRSSYDSKFVDVKSQNSFLVSAEGGYRFNVNNNFYLEPSLEIITGYIGKYESSLKIFNKFKINVDAHSPLIFKPQIFAGYSVNDFTFRAGVGAVIDTQTKEADLLIGDIIKGVNAKVKSKLGASDRGFVSVGTAYTFSDNLRLNLSVERSFGTKLTNDYEINSTIRYTF